jgi:hypothetical protein
MANVYVRSGAAGTGTGADWANAYTTLAAAFAAKAAGDSFWVADDHAESQASAMTCTSPGTIANPCFVYCVNRAGSVPPVAADLRTTATITTTGNNSITLAGSAYYYGITFQAGSGAVNAIFSVNASSAFNKFEACQLAKLGTTGTTNAIQFTATANAVGTGIELINTTMKFGSTSDSIRADGRFKWSKTTGAIAGATMPTTLFGTFGNTVGSIFLDALDLSALGSGKTLFGSPASTQEVFIRDCKLGSGVTVSVTPASPSDRNVYLTRSDSAGTNYRAEKYSYPGSETTETSIVRSGGASDGATPQSRKLVTNANAKWIAPFEGFPLAIFCNTAGAVKTVTVHGVSGAAGGLNNDDVWIDVVYPADASSGLGGIATSTKASNLASNSAYSASGATWNGSPSGTPFTMTATFTPAQIGWVYIYPKVGKASATIYIDPKVTLS